MNDAHELTCKEFVELVTDYLEGALDAATHRRFEEHLALCEGCETYLEQMRKTARLLGSIPEESVSAEVRMRLLTAFRDWRSSGPSRPHSAPGSS